MPSEHESAGNDSEGKTARNREQDSAAESRQAEAEQERRRLPFWRMILSVAQASFGVQTRENKERDFAHGSVAGFIVAALIFTVVFVLTLMFVVSRVID